MDDTSLHDFMETRKLLEEAQLRAPQVLNGGNVSTIRNRLIIQGDKLMRSGESNVVDVIWQSAWYKPIGTFVKATRKQKNDRELRDFLQTAIAYYSGLLESQPGFAFKFNVYLGDIYRYMHKLCNSSDATLQNGLKHYQAALKAKPRMHTLFLKMSLLFKDNDLDLCMVHYIRYLLTSNQGEMPSGGPVFKADTGNMFVDVSAAFLQNEPSARDLLFRMEKHILESIRDSTVNNFVNEHYNFIVFASASFVVKDEKLVEAAASIWGRIFSALLSKTLCHIRTHFEDHCPVPYPQNVTTALQYVDIPLSMSSALTLLQVVTPSLLCVIDWLRRLSLHFESSNMSVGMRMVIHCLLSTLVTLLNSLLPYLKPMLNSSEVLPDFSLVFQGIESLTQDQAVPNLVNSLNLAILDSQFPIDYSEQFTFTWPRLRNVKPACTSGSSQSQVNQRCACLLSKCALLNYGSNIDRSLTNLNVTYIIDQHTANYISANNSFRSLKFGKERLNQLRTAGKLVILDNDYNIIEKAKTWAAAEGIDDLRVVLDPAEQLSCEVPHPEEVTILTADQVHSSFATM